MIRIVDHGSFFYGYISFDRQFSRNVADMKSIPNVRWNGEKKAWWIPGECRQEVSKLAIRRSITIEVWEPSGPQLVGEIAPLPDLDIELPIKNAVLRQYQRQGAARGMQLRRFLIGDEPGLGKTIQSIATCVGLKEKGVDVFPALVICPATLKENWKREFEKFSDHKAAILTDSTRNTWPQYFKAGMIDVFIVNYESLKKFFVESMPTKVKRSKDIVMRENINLFKTIIVDESHKVKNPATMQTKLTARIAQGKENRILLSGTPVMSRPLELYTQLVILGQIQHFGGTEKAFKDRYCDGGKGASNLRELNYLLNQHCFFRREKKDVAKDLPDKQRQRITCEITTKQEYDYAERNFSEFLSQSGATKGQIDKKLRAEALVKINELKAISARGKMAETREFIDEIMDAEQKLVVFCNRKAIVQELKLMYPHAVTITGDDTMEERQRHIDSFQQDPNCKLILCNFKAAGVGVTLTASWRVLFVELPWTYADFVQAEDRTHRIGQKNAVMSSILIGKDTIDEWLFDLIIEKKDIANAITGGTDEMEVAMVDNVINLFNNRKNVRRETAVA